MNTTRMTDQHASASDDSLAAVAAAMKAKDRPIRLRLPLQLWNGKQYGSWKQEAWRVEVKDVEEAKRLRAVLEELFTLLGREGGVEQAFTALEHQLILANEPQPGT